MRLSPQRLILPLLVSFSLTGAGVILLYLLNKPNNDDEKKIKSKAEKNKIEIQIPRQFVPAIIGRGGTVIEDIQKITGTNISFKEESNVDEAQRTCIIVGTIENIKLAEEKIKQILKNQPIVETYETWVPQRTINRITERGGEILNHIQNSSNAKIILDNSSPITSNLDTMKRVILKGTAKQISDALVQVEDRVLEDKQNKNKTENSSFTRVPRIKSPIATPTPVTEDNSKDVNYTKETFGKDKEGLIEVFVCAMESPSQFYIQMVGPLNDKLDDLVTEMTEYYENEENRELHALHQIVPGKIVASKFSVDDKWYRAEIVSDLGDDKYDVYFVDFGDREPVESKNILELRTDFLSLRLQAIECSLSGVKPRQGEWTEEAADKFSQLSALANWQPRVAKIRGYKERGLGYGPCRREGSPIPCIELYDKRDDQLINIGKELIKLELASPENEPWSAASSTLSLSRRSQDSRAKSPEVLPASNGAVSNGSSLRSAIEEIDLVSPQPKKETSKNVEVIDLTTPGKNSRTESSRNFIENERNSPVTSNGSNGDSRSSYNKKNKPANPFKRSNKQATSTTVRSFVPAGYESDLSDESDGFDIY